MAALVTVVFAGIVQLATVLHVRNTLIDCASEGARYAGLADRDLDDGVRRTRELIQATLAPRYASEVTARHSDVAGLPVVEVQVRAPLPVAGLLGPAGVLAVRGHGVEERP